MSAKTTHEFKAEVRQLLDILVHSLYTNKEIFLRELVSNASDALNKFRWETGLGADEQDGPELEIRIDADKEAGTLTIADTGIGMTEDELIQNLGTIAHSGSAEFAKEAAEGKESIDSLIGRFGVGFYSVYMAADEVVVTTRSYREDARPVVWTSDGKGEYVIEDAPADTPRGTSILVKLRDELKEQFTDTAALKGVINRHSNFISYPIYVEDERVNTIPALWREPKFQIKPEQYNEFYTFQSLDPDEPLHVIHTSVDAPVQYNALMFIPKHTQDPLGIEKEDWGLDLFVRRVLIQRKNRDLLPPYLSFVQGVADTEDLPLNISRETLQDNLLIRKIQSNLTKQVLSELEKMFKDDRDTYYQFWDAHESTFKGGYMDFLNRDKFASLLLFNSSTHEEATELTSLDEYIERAKEGQKELYYAFGPSREAINLNPHLEIFRRKGLEVLYMYEPVDEFIMDTLREYKDFKLVAAEHADASGLDKFEAEEKKDDVKQMSKEEAESFPGLLGRIREVLGERVTEVKASQRLSDSPVCLANPDGAVTSSMDKIMRVMNKDTSIPKKVLEVNPDHALIRNLIDIYAANPQDSFIEQAANQLFESALLLEGYLTDPHALVGRIQDLLTSSSGWYADLKK